MKQDAQHHGRYEGDEYRENKPPCFRLARQVDKHTPQPCREKHTDREDRAQLYDDLKNPSFTLEAEQIAERFFSAPEITLLQALSLQQKQETFFIFWTRKEAYLKATGAGLARPLDQFDVSLGSKLTVPGDPQEAARWSICDLKPAEGFVGALAVAGYDWQLKCWQF